MLAIVVICSGILTMVYNMLPINDILLFINK